MNENIKMKSEILIIINVNKIRHTRESCLKSSLSQK